jgi:hypothetical protein
VVRAGSSAGHDDNDDEQRDKPAVHISYQFQGSAGLILPDLAQAPT